MDFFGAQLSARKQSRRLLWLFGFAVLAMVLAINVLTLLVLGASAEPGQGLFDDIGQRAPLLFAVSALTVAVIGVASMYKISQLRGGGHVVATSVGGVPVPLDTTDPLLRRLRNVVEEIAIASGVPVPQVFVLEREIGINAFAAGYAPADAAIAVTRGALERLNREELQGVIAHEFSHVLNGDMRVNIRLMGVLFGILILAIAGREVLLHTGGSRSRDAAAIVAIALALMAIGYIGMFMGRLIKAGVSRQREYLADASAVQFTRDTSGISGALKKIAAFPGGSRLVYADAEQISHMMFGDGVGYSALFATHPPLAARIVKLDPSFKAPQLEPLRLEMAKAFSPTRNLAEARAELAQAQAPSALGALPALPALLALPALPDAALAMSLTPASVPGQVANPLANDYALAGAILAALDSHHAALARAQDSAPWLIVALALAKDPTLRDQQLAMVEQHIDAAAAQSCATLFATLTDLHPLLRLPLAQLAFPVLRRQPKSFLEQFIALLDLVVHADGEVDLAEYCLMQMIIVQVLDVLTPHSQQGFGSLKIVAAREPVAVLLSLMAQVGHRDPLAARQAFNASVAQLGGRVALTYAPPDDWRAALDAAWPVLDRLDPHGKQLLTEALARALAHDGRIALAEAELLRTVCARLHCPLPPMLSR